MSPKPLQFDRFSEDFSDSDNGVTVSQAQHSYFGDELSVFMIVKNSSPVEPGQMDVGPGHNVAQHRLWEISDTDNMYVFLVLGDTPEHVKRVTVIVSTKTVRRQIPQRSFDQIHVFGIVLSM